MLLPGKFIPLKLKKHHILQVYFKNKTMLFTLDIFDDAWNLI